MEDPIGTEAIAAISRRFLMPSYPFFKEMSPEEKRQAADKKALEYRTNTESGLVPIRSDEEGRWSISGRYDYFERWVTRDAWDRYVRALTALTAAEAELA
jgi:hypothetical protein